MGSGINSAGENAAGATAATIERLHELLTIKDDQLAAAEQANGDLLRQIEFGVDWMRHSKGDVGDVLPVPRIQMRLVVNEDYRCESVVEIVLASRAGRVDIVPLEYSRRSGGGVDVAPWPVSGDVADVLLRHGTLPGLFHDACFHGEKTRLPVVLVLDAEHRYVVTSFRPLKMTALPPAAGGSANVA